jgi:hypothetical protein
MCRQVCALLCLVASVAAGQSRHDVIKGHVASDSGKVVADAEIIVTMAPTRVVVSAKGDSTGSYELQIPSGTGEYLVFITATGMTPYRKRLTATGGDTTFVVDAKLSPALATALAASRSVASGARPPRTTGLDPAGVGVNASDRSPDGVYGSLPPELAANLEALATTLPGFTMTPGGLSTFGMSGANMATLNGLAMGVGELPRDAKMTSRFQTSPYDPTMGGFAGAQLGLSFGSGGALSYRRAHLSLDAPPLQAGQPGAALLGQKNYNTVVGYGADGPIVPLKYFYNYAAQFSRSVTPVASLLDLESSALMPNGLAVDSARRFVQILQAQQVPITARGIPFSPTTTAGSFIARLDRGAQPSATPGGLTSAPWWILATGQLRQRDAGTLSPVLLPGFTDRQNSGSAGLQGFYSTYAGPARLWLNETMVALAGSTSRGEPYLDLPSGNVLVSSLLDDGSQSVRSLSFGGNSASHRLDDAWSAEVANSTTWFPGTHTSRPIKLFFKGRYDGFNQVVGASRLGSFNFASLADLASNTPTSFSRTLNMPNRGGGEYSGVAAIGVNWTVKTVNIIGGLRGDGNAYTKTPPLNPSVQSAFGLSTQTVPNTIALSPRLGFNWMYKPQQVVGLTSGMLARTYYAPTSIRGGIGRFRNLLPPTLIADALTSTGLPDGAARLSCVGPAAPIPNWSAYAVDAASIPTQCAGGASTFSDASPNVIAFDRDYRPQDAWRATVGSSRTFWRRTYLSVDAAYSINLDQPSSIDLNFAGSPKMFLANESNRPVFVSAASIVPSTGALSPVEARVSPAFGRVTERRSDLRSEVKQLTIYSLPNASWFDPFIAVSYTYADVRAKLRGFDATTSGDPRSATWAPESYTPRHRVILQTGKYFKGFGLTAFTSLASGVQFTPTVNGDINGDGLANDRAFVFDPAAVGDTVLAKGLRGLLDNGPSRVRSCLRAQLNSIAGQSSCSGPWTASMNARLSYNKDIPRIGRRAVFSLNFANPLVGLDMLLHGSGGLHGWGATAYPDPTLLYVRGFDPNTGRFKYEANPRFGATAPRTTAIISPFRLTIDVSFNLGRDVAVQQVEINMRPPAGQLGPRASADTIKMRFMLNNSIISGTQDVYKYIVSLKDSLALSSNQIASLEAARVPFRAKVDSMYTALANYLFSLPSTFDGDAAAKRIRETNTATWKCVADQGKPIQAILSPTQMQLLSPPVINTLTKGFTGTIWAVNGARWW